MPARLPSWAWVTGLTTGAIAAVAVLAVQADQGPKPTASTSRPSASATADAKPSAAPKEKETGAEAEAESQAVPADSGTGRRIVYSLDDQQVWLVDASDAPRRSFEVWPGTVSPDPGTYTIGTRTEATTGSDGVAVEHIVYFAAKSGVSIAFSNAVDGSSPPPPDGRTTGGIRVGKADGKALWAFGTPGTTVRVVE
ncbi:L,D-transpeptidase [Streptomyces sp. M2CJ-2]|uniref:L,D-transpeptidase n=1 Tax=Streptomyces sp. M2CJ-2 TaxID=2803948 RepID=UPI0019261F95|nr:L,D-transpeptidase [Streptomyces sp. M2CJ-2]MBL3671032.1 L,D-transpeptidase [Streptomyces sp. M2CJ-2]